MRNTPILLSGIALALAGAVATPTFAHTHHRHMASSLHRQSTPAERQQTAQLNQQQLAQSTSASMNGGMATGATAPNDGSMAVNNRGGESTATETNAGSNATGMATQQNGLTTEPTSYRRTRSNSGAGMSGTSGTGSVGVTGTATGTGGAGAGQDQQTGSPMSGNMQGNPSGAVSPPPAANPSGTPQ